MKDALSLLSEVEVYEAPLNYDYCFYPHLINDIASK
jgi:hypothetical protein